ncbi:MAG: response regulator [Bacteroidia bacterium]|nr:response regulator [Bacteroidia bacterium]
MKTKIRILHIDDNIHDRMLIRDALQKEHDEFDLAEADSREIFEKYITKNNFDLVLSDFNILGFDGLQVLQVVKEINPDLPVIIVTGTGSEEIAIQAMKMGAADYVIKSVSHIKGLAPTIKAVLERKKAEEERKKAVEELQKREEFLTTIIDNIPNMIFMKDAKELKFVRFNKAGENLLGVKSEEIIGKTDYDFFPKNQADFFVKIDRDVLQTKQMLDIPEEPIDTKSGKRILHTKKIVILDKSEKPAFLLGISEDITERKQIEDALRESQLLFKTLADASPVGIFRTDTDGNTTYVNPKWSELSGLSFEEAIGNNWLHAVHPDDRVRLFVDWKSDVKKEQKSFAEYRFLKPDKSVVWVIGNAVPEITDNVIKGYIGTITNITERKSVEEELLIAKEKAEESDRLKTAFLQNMSHEIRTPMNAICGFSEMLGKADLTAEKRENFTNIIINSSNRLLSVVTDILTISSLETNQEKINYEIVNVNELIAELLSIFKIQANSKSILLQMQQGLNNEASEIYTDRTKLYQILSNLINNALKFTSKGTIEFGYIHQENNLQFFVKDTGVGIKPEFKDKIFERFRQADKSIQSRYGGTGLGLSISKAFVELMGGKIWLESVHDKGTVFYFTIPYKKGVKEEVKIKSGGQINETGTILIAEDEENNFRYLEELLIEYKFKILYAKDGKEAVDICKKNHEINLVLMDIKMPVMNGLEATKQIKEIFPNLPIIAQSAYALEHEVIGFKKQGFDDYITKPINISEFIAKISHYLIKNPKE